MKDVPIEKKRNICLVGHNSSGKTSLVEAILYHKGVVERMGKPDDGTAFTDYTDEEKRRHISIHTALATLTHKAHQVTILDAPGFADFIAEVRDAMRVADSAVIVVAADAGVQTETEKVYKFAREFDIPALAFVTKMDKENADFAKCVDSIKSHFDLPVVVTEFPIGSQADLKGIVDVVRMKAIYYDDKGHPTRTEDIPADLQAQAEEYRENLMDTAAEQDEAVMEKYLEGNPLSDEEIIAGLASGIASRSFIPVMCGSAHKTIGVETLLDYVVNFLPSPFHRGEVTVKDANDQEVTLKPDPKGPLCAYIWKTSVDPYAGRLSFFRVFSGTITGETELYNSNKHHAIKPHGVLSINGKSHTTVPQATPGDIAALGKIEGLETGETLASKAKAYIMEKTTYPTPQIRRAMHAIEKADEEKLGTVLPRIVEEDPTLTLDRNAETHELVIAGQGELHLDIVCERLKKQGVNVELKTPKVAYRETVTKQSEGSYRHKKQSGGRGQFGEVHLRIEPRASGEGFEFADEIVGGVIPSRFIPAVEKGVVERMQRGIIAGYPVVDVKVALFYGKTHDVDSSEMAFKIAGSMGFKEIAAQCNPILLEPIHLVEVIVPEEYMGDVIGDLNSKRGRILGMEPADGMQHVKAQVPEAEMHSYSTDLRSIARGRGSYLMQFDHYEQVPNEIAEKIVSSAKMEEDEED